MLDQMKEAARRLGVRRFWKRPLPSNLQERDRAPATIAADVAYAIQCGRSYRSQLESKKVNCDGARILEVGPGVGFGAAAYLVASGASVTVADRWLAPWQDGYHDKFYAALAKAIVDEVPNPRVIARLAERGSYDGGPISLLPISAERLSSAKVDPFDVIMSNAVLEHVPGLAAAARALHAATRPGGFGFHQIDMRDHRDFSRPLEYLLFTAAAWEKLSTAANWEYGSQRRKSAYEDAFRNTGFELVEVAVNEHSDPTYLAEFKARLARTEDSPCRRASQDDLESIGALFIVRRPAN